MSTVQGAEGAMYCRVFGVSVYGGIRRRSVVRGTTVREEGGLRCKGARGVTVPQETN